MVHPNYVVDQRDGLKDAYFEKFLRRTSQNCHKMKISFTILSFIFLFLIVIPQVSGITESEIDVHKLFTARDLRASITDNASISGVTANITVRDPDWIVLVSSQPMTNLPAGSTDWNYTLQATNVTKTGIYTWTVCAFSTSERKCTGYKFLVTPSGKLQTSILDNSILLIFGIFGILLLILGIYQGNSWYGFIGSILFLLSGIYTMIYGFNNEQNFYTQGIALTLLGVSFIFMFLSAYEWVWGEKEE